MQYLLTTKEKPQLPGSNNVTISSSLDRFVEQQTNPEGYKYQVFAYKYGSLMASIDARYKFPLGHPVEGQLYKQHPLAFDPDSGKEFMYLPYETFDEILVQERESELKRLLIDLGATEIHIQTLKTSEHSSEKSSEFNTNFSSAFKANVKEESTRASGEFLSSGKHLKLQGKKWIEGDTLDRSKYIWLKYEQDWESLVEAREVGFCTEFTKTLSQTNTSLEKDSLSLDLKVMLFGASYVKTEKQQSKLHKSWAVHTTFQRVQIDSV